MDGTMDEAARRVRRAAEYRAAQNGDTAQNGDAAQNVDPDWWLKELIIREQLTGLAPEPFLLRKDDAELDARLRAEPTEAAVRQVLMEFNRRVVSARRQLLGGPPVITRTRDIDAEVARWKAGRRPTEPVREDTPAPAPRQLRWWRRPGR
ncbi:hypothetical protein [Arthrobacter sp. CAN_A1]|uniref:hypothetical protein n=1 Tax=Arthrobacter sp. CAN_A1 TaxID=2787717 RepID=UPI0018CAB0C1